MTQIIVALIGLLGATLGVVFGFYQWRRTQDINRQAHSVEARRNAHELLWNKLEEINVALREKGEANPQAYTMIREFNRLYLKNSLYVSDETQRLCNRYLESLEKMRVAVYTAGNEDVINYFERTFARLPPSLIKEVDEASAEASRLRDKVREALQRVK